MAKGGVGAGLAVASARAGAGAWARRDSGKPGGDAIVVAPVAPAPPIPPLATRVAMINVRTSDSVDFGISHFPHPVNPCGGRIGQARDLGRQGSGRSFVRSPRLQPLDFCP